MQPRVYGVFLFGIIGMGCVTKGTYTELEERHAVVTRQRDEAQTALQGCQSTQASLEKHASETEKSREELKKTSASQLAELQRSKTKVELVEGERARLEASQAEMQKALDALLARKAESEKRVAEYRSLLQRFKSMIDAGKLDVKIVDGRMVVALPTDILFAPGAATLSKDGRAAIAEVAALLVTIPERRFQVEGHTDNRPIGTAQFPSNWELAAARALSVVKAMLDANMPPQRLSAASFAEFRPVDVNSDPEGRAANRRVDIVVEPDLSQLPGFDELRDTGK